jgi:hypothetical protein
MVFPDEPGLTVPGTFCISGRSMYNRRLATNDPGIIEQLARRQGMIGRDELVLIPKAPIPQKKRSGAESDADGSSRLISDYEFDFLINFDVESFKFYEELIEAD